MKMKSLGLFLIQTHEYKQKGDVGSRVLCGYFLKRRAVNRQRIACESRNKLLKRDVLVMNINYVLDSSSKIGSYLNFGIMQQFAVTIIRLV